MTLCVNHTTIFYGLAGQQTQHKYIAQEMRSHRCRRKAAELGTRLREGIKSSSTIAGAGLGKVQGACNIQDGVKARIHRYNASAFHPSFAPSSHRSSRISKYHIIQSSFCTANCMRFPSHNLSFASSPFSRPLACQSS